ncbi:MAG: VanZ family protein [Clostridiales bacterium]|nr:VanZ family protein [Clostridiales bacterium]
MRKNQKIIFIIYLLLFLLFVILKFDGSFNNLINTYNNIMNNRNNGIVNINLIPFRTINSYLKTLPSIFSIYNLLGNIIPFIPLGYFVSLYFNKNNIFKITFIFIFILFFIEFIQLIFLIGFFDIDDIILNFIGLIIGYIIKRKFN